MQNLEVLLRRADECLRAADQETDRRRIRELLVKAHSHLKIAEEIKAEEITRWRDLP
jgi:hypothetical protein